MAGFAINLRAILEKSNVWFGMTVKGKQSQTGQLETDLLEHFTTRDQVECRGSNSEVCACLCVVCACLCVVCMYLCVCVCSLCACLCCVCM